MTDEPGLKRADLSFAVAAAKGPPDRASGPTAQPRETRLLHRIADAVSAFADCAEFAEADALWRAAPDVVRCALDASWVAVRVTAGDSSTFLETGPRDQTSPASVVPVFAGFHQRGDLLVGWGGPGERDEGHEAAGILARQLGQAIERAERRGADLARARRSADVLFSLPEVLRRDADAAEVLDAALATARDALLFGPASPDSSTDRGVAIIGQDSDRDRFFVGRADSPWAAESIRALLDQPEVHRALLAGPVDLQVRLERRRRADPPASPTDDLARLQASPLGDDPETRGWLAVVQLVRDVQSGCSEPGYLERVARLVGAVIQAASRAEQQRYFLDEFAHRVRNNLLTLVQMVEDERGRPLDAASLARVQDWLRALLGIYGALEDNDFTRVDLRRLVDHVTSIVLGGWPSVESDIDSLSLNSPRGTVLGIVVAELLQNVRKHAYPDGVGRVRITGREDGSRRVVVVEDWGVGVTEGWRPRGKGIRLMRRLLAGVGGSIRFANRPEGGMIATVVLREDGRRDPTVPSWIG